MALPWLCALALYAIWQSGLPLPGKALASAYAVLSCAWTWRRQLRAPPHRLCVYWHAQAPEVDGVPVQMLRVCWRGPIASLSWRGARRARQRLVFWPDQFSAAQRRELRLAAQAHAISPQRR